MKNIYGSVYSDKNISALVKSISGVKTKNEKLHYYNIRTRTWSHRTPLWQ